jgi:radical SAM protein with 4Fe4S-binding SPASM domain
MSLKIYMNDFSSFFSAISFSRGINIILSYTGYLLSSLFRIPIVLGLPFSCSIEPTTRCNLHCPECLVGSGMLKREKGDLPLDSYRTLVQSIHKHTSYIALYLQGEPFLNKHIIEMVRIAKEYKIYTCISTNGHYLDRSNATELVQAGLNRIIVSLDGLSQESYSKYRINGNFNQVIDGIRNLVNVKRELHSKTPIVIIQFIVFRYNEGDIEEFKQLGKELMVDRVDIKTAQHYDLSNKNSLMTSLDKYNRYKYISNGNWVIKKRLKNHCLRLWTNAVITWNGTLIPCCYDKNADFNFGTISSKSFVTLWKNKKFMKYRKSVLDNRKSVNICRNCGE